MEKKTRFNFWFLVVAVALVILAQSWWEPGHVPQEIAYSEFQTLLEDGRLESVSVSATTIRGKLKDAASGEREYVQTIRVDPDFARELGQYDVEFGGTVESDWPQLLLSWLLPVDLH